MRSACLVPETCQSRHLHQYQLPYLFLLQNWLTCHGPDFTFNLLFRHFFNIFVILQFFSNLYHQSTSACVFLAFLPPVVPSNNLSVTIKSSYLKIHQHMSNFCYVKTVFAGHVLRGLFFTVYGYYWILTDLSNCCTA